MLFLGEAKLLALMRNFGLPVTLTIFFVWQGAIRESQLNARIDKLEDYVRNELVDLVKENHATSRRTAEILLRVERSLDDMHHRSAWNAPQEPGRRRHDAAGMALDP